MAASPVLPKPVCVIVRSQFFGRGKWSGGRMLLPGTRGVLRGRLADGSAYIEFDGFFGIYHITPEQWSCLDVYGEPQCDMQGKHRKDGPFRIDGKLHIERGSRVVVKHRFHACGKHSGQVLQVGTEGVVVDVLESGAYIEFENYSDTFQISFAQQANLIFLASPAEAKRRASRDSEDACQVAAVDLKGALVPSLLEPNAPVIVTESFYGLGKVNGSGKLEVGTKGIVKDVIIDAAYIEFEGHAESYCITLEQYSHLALISEDIARSKETENSNTEKNCDSHSEEVRESASKLQDGQAELSDEGLQVDGNVVIREHIDMIVDMIGDVVVGTQSTGIEKPNNLDAAPEQEHVVNAVQNVQHERPRSSSDPHAEEPKPELKAPNGMVLRPASRVVAKDEFYSHGKWYGGAQLQPGTAGIVTEVLEDGVYVEFDGIYGTCHVTVDQLAKLGLAEDQDARLSGKALRFARMKRLFEVDHIMEADRNLQAQSSAECREVCGSACHNDPDVCLRNRVDADRVAEGRRAVQAMCTQRKQAIEKLQREAECAVQLLEERSINVRNERREDVLRPDSSHSEPTNLWASMSESH